MPKYKKEIGAFLLRGEVVQVGLLLTQALVHVGLLLAQALVHVGLLLTQAFVLRNGPRSDTIVSVQVCNHTKNCIGMVPDNPKGDKHTRRDVR